MQDQKNRVLVVGAGPIVMLPPWPTQRKCCPNRTANR